MDTAGHCIAETVVEKSKRSPRGAAAAALTEFDQRDSAWTSPSQIARQLHVLDSTLRYWRGQFLKVLWLRLLRV